MRVRIKVLSERPPISKNELKIDMLQNILKINNKKKNNLCNY